MSRFATTCLFASLAGDGIAAAFELASDAIAAARSIRSALDAERWPSPVELRVRIGLHSGDASRRNGDYHGAAVNRAARVMAAAHGGQTLVSDVTVGLISANDGLGDQGVCQLEPALAGWIKDVARNRIECVAGFEFRPTFLVPFRLSLLVQFVHFVRVSMIGGYNQDGACLFNRWNQSSEA